MAIAVNGPVRVLYQFPLSLYCEKTRWNLDARHLEYTCRDLVPGLHAPLAWWLAGIRTLPILRDGPKHIGDSSTIALYLEERYSAHRLVPENPVDRDRVMKLEEYFDELGDHVRRCVWSMAVGLDSVDRIFFGFAGYGGLTRALSTLTRPLLRTMIRRTFNVREAAVTASWPRIAEGLDLLEDLTRHDPDRYLIADRFTLADLTAAAMLAPLIGPPGSPWMDEHVGRENVDPEMLALREHWRQRPAGQWVWNIYRKHRGEVKDRGSRGMPSWI